MRLSGKWIVRLVALVVAIAVGVGAGYLLWGRAKDWYDVANPATLPAGEENDLIRYGHDLIVETAANIGKSARNPALAYAGNDLNCTNCHINAGLRPFSAPLVSTYTTYPMMTDDRVLTLAERINGCMTRSMNGKPLPEDGREMQAFIAYMRYIGLGSPEGVRVAGMGLMPLKPPAEDPSAARGEAVYAENCARCHGADGKGSPAEPPQVGYAVPPLWGDDAYNAAAGMADIRTAAAFVRANMPDGITWLDPMLSEQQAWDVAAYMDSKPRPPRPPAQD
ncbi:MAG: c-type cytochrome [Bauldia sp.]|nr:c-type cytochrome [Bauldia sp.]